MSEDAPKYRRALARDSGLASLALLASAGTLVCCALPLLLISLGLGAAVAALTSSFPWLVALSHYKEAIFAVSFVLLSASGWFIHRSGRRCPADPELARACARIHTVNRWILGASIIIWLIGFFAAFLLPPLLR